MADEVLKFSPRITALPIVYGSGDFALEVRRLMLTESFDCLAVPLPPSFQADVEEAVERLPGITIVAQGEQPPFHTEWRGDRDEDDEDDEPDATVSYVPVDPCQGVIVALRIAIQERMARSFIDLETRHFQAYGSAFPDPYALKRVPPERFAAAVLPALPRIPDGQPRQRIAAMAQRLHELEERYKSILFVCSLLDWPWIREAYKDRAHPAQGDEDVEDTAIYRVEPQTLTFVLGELPFITGLYERARSELEDDEDLSIDGVKEMLLAAREAYQADFRGLARAITPQMLSLYLKYVRNLSLMHRRITPDLYTLIVAAQQVAGDGFALHLAETAREYPYTAAAKYPTATVSLDEARLDNGQVVRLISRLPGPPIVWRHVELKPRPLKIDQEHWRMRWDPFRSCSWPPEDTKIEQFRTHVMDRARAMLNSGLARSEKFTTSILDGIDIRETLRNWHTGDLWVKVLPPDRGDMECVVMLFDSPAEPREYPWRSTWFAEHEQESTLAFFATDYRQNLVGPGIAMGTYGGAMFIYPPRPIPDIWQDPRLDFTDTLEERLLAAACLHSRDPHIALLSPGPPGAAWRKLAKQFGKKWVHLPLSGFSGSTVQRLRMVHVLNGREIRSYAAYFIRRP